MPVLPRKREFPLCGVVTSSVMNINPEQIRLLLLWFPVFLFSLTLHEFSHALLARMGGDMTATYKGRLTLNPLPHIDPVGTVIFPILAGLTGLPLFGWAKPVPVNEVKLRHSRWTVAVSLAGPMSNIFLVIISALLLKLLVMTHVLGPDPDLGVNSWQTILSTVLLLFILTNVLLAIFNLLPIPPLDGSHVVHYYLVRRNPALWTFWEFLMRYGMIILWVLVFMTPLRHLLSDAIYGTVGFIQNWVVN